MYYGFTRRGDYPLRLYVSFQVQAFGFIVDGIDADIRRAQYISLGAVVPLRVFFFDDKIDLQFYYNTFFLSGQENEQTFLEN